MYAWLTLDFLKVLRFSFPLPVVGPTARFATESIKKFLARALRSRKILRSTCGQVYAYADKWANSPQTLTWKTKHTSLRGLLKKCKFRKKCLPTPPLSQSWHKQLLGEKRSFRGGVGGQFPRILCLWILLHLPHMLVGGIILSSPGLGAINSFTIDRQPFSHLQQSLLEYWHNSAICCWSNIHEHISTTAI